MDEPPTFVSSSSKISSPFTNFLVDNGLKKKMCSLCIGTKSKILYDNHDIPCVEHHGMDKTIQLIRMTFWCDQISPKMSTSMPHNILSIK